MGSSQRAVQVHGGPRPPKGPANRAEPQTSYFIPVFFACTSVSLCLFLHLLLPRPKELNGKRNSESVHRHFTARLASKDITLRIRVLLSEKKPAAEQCTNYDPLVAKKYRCECMCLQVNAYHRLVRLNPTHKQWLSLGSSFSRQKVEQK